MLNLVVIKVKFGRDNVKFGRDNVKFGRDINPKPLAAVSFQTP